MKKYLAWTETKLARFWLRLANNCENTAESLSILRIIYGFFILIFINLSFTWIATIPQGLFRPKFFSLSNLFSGFPSYTTLLAIEILLLICGFCILLGIQARIAGIFFVIVYIIGNSFRFSFGKVDHGEILFLVFILGLSFTNWGTKYALFPDRHVSRNRQRKILAILAVFLCFGMFTAGYEKALYWVDFDLKTGGFLRWFYNGYFTNGRDLLLAPLVLRLPPQIFELADYFAVIFELIPLVALFFGRRWWLLWLLIASIFHLANTLLLNISFIAHAPVYLSFINLSEFNLLEKINLHLKIKLTYLLSFIASLIGVHYLKNLLSGKSIYSPLEYLAPFFSSLVELELYISLFVWLTTILLIGLTVIKKFSSNRLLIDRQN